MKRLCPVCFTELPENANYCLVCGKCMRENVEQTVQYMEKRVLRWFVSVDKVADAAVPDMNETRAYKNHINGYPQGSTPAGDGFMNIPDGIDEELPFN